MFTKRQLGREHIMLPSVVNHTLIVYQINHDVGHCANNYQRW